MAMADVLLLLTQVSSLAAFILMGIAVSFSIFSLLKFTGEGKFKTSILFSTIYLFSFMLSVGFMSIYHWNDSEIMEILWHIGLNLGFIFGIISAIYSLNFWKNISFKKK